MSKVVVSINKRDYSISGNKAPDEIEKIAGRVNEEMEKIAEAQPFSSRADIAVLAALNLSEEIFDADKREKQKQVDKAQEEAKETQEKIQDYENKIQELQNKVSEYENNFFDLQMENIRLKNELEKLR